MASRPLFIIVAVGVLGLAAMGALSKFALDGSKGLAKVVEFKAELLETFGDRGIQSVAYRKEGTPRRVVLRLGADAPRIAADAELHRGIAELLAESFPDEGSDLTLSYHSPSRFGCSAPAPFLEREFPIAEVREALRLRAWRESLVKSLASRPELEVLDVEARKKDCFVRIGWRGPAVPTPEDAAKTVADVALAVAKDFRLARNAEIHVRLDRRPPAAKSAPTAPDPIARPIEGRADADGRAAAPAGSAPALAEGVFDFRGKPRAGRKR